MKSVPNVADASGSAPTRELEEKMLVAFDPVVAHGTPELMLVSGYSRIGRSSTLTAADCGLSLTMILRRPHLFSRPAPDNSKSL